MVGRGAYVAALQTALLNSSQQSDNLVNVLKLIFLPPYIARATSSSGDVITSGSASTPNQALTALLFLDREQLEGNLKLAGMVRARQPQHLPVVLTHDEVPAVLSRLPISSNAEL